jgi:hypothetical protein
MFGGLRAVAYVARKQKVYSNGLAGEIPRQSFLKKRFTKLIPNSRNSPSRLPIDRTVFARF